MTCPCCGGPMVNGVFCDRGDSYFLPEGEKAPTIWTKRALQKKGAVLLPPEAVGVVWAQRPTAFWCGACKKLLVDYSNLMSPEGQGKIM